MQNMGGVHNLGIEKSDDLGGPTHVVRKTNSSYFRFPFCAHLIKGTL